MRREILTIGQSLIVALVISLTCELLIFLYNAPTMLLAAFGKGEEIKGESREYNLRALTLGGLTFASITLLFTIYHNSIATIADVLLLLVLSLAFFFLSYSIEVLVRIRRIYWVIQDKTLSFGYLATVFAFMLLFQQIIPTVLLIFLPVIVIIVAIHIREFSLDFQNWAQQENAQKKYKPKQKGVRRFLTSD